MCSSRAAVLLVLQEARQAVRLGWPTATIFASVLAQPDTAGTAQTAQQLRRQTQAVAVSTLAAAPVDPETPGRLLLRGQGRMVAAGAPLRLLVPLQLQAVADQAVLALGATAEMGLMRLTYTSAVEAAVAAVRLQQRRRWAMAVMAASLLVGVAEGLTVRLTRAV